MAIDPERGGARDAAEVRRRTEVAVEELVGLLLDQLVPVAGWYRELLARRLGTSTAGLAVLEQAQRGPTTAGRAGRRTGMTPSAMTKVVRRLEAQGHVTRVPSGTHDQELDVVLRPHPERDAVLAGVRGRVVTATEHLVGQFGLADPDRLRLAGNALLHALCALDREVGGLEARADRLAVLARRRAAREAAGFSW